MNVFKLSIMSLQLFLIYNFSHFQSVKDNFCMSSLMTYPVTDIHESSSVTLNIRTLDLSLVSLQLTTQTKKSIFSLTVTHSRLVFTNKMLLYLCQHALNSQLDLDTQ